MILGKILIKIIIFPPPHSQLICKWCISHFIITIIILYDCLYEDGTDNMLPCTIYRLKYWYWTKVTKNIYGDQGSTGSSPAFRRHMFMSATCFQAFMAGSYTSQLFLTSGPSCPPTANSRPFSTPTPASRFNRGEGEGFQHNPRAASLLSQMINWPQLQCEFCGGPTSLELSGTFIFLQLYLFYS